MKALFIHSFLITTLLSLVGCGSKENSVKLEVSAGFALTSAGYTGGLVVSGKNAIGQRFVKTVFGGSSLNVVLPDGAWELNVVGWDGPTPSLAQTPFSGEAYCGKTLINLASTDTSASVTVNQANCLTADFSDAPYIDAPTQTIHPLKIVTCGSFYRHTAEHTLATPSSKITSGNAAGATGNSDFCNSSFHPVDMKSRTKSIKLIPINKNFDAAFTGQPTANPFCHNVNSGEGVFYLPLRIPVTGLPFQVAFFDDANCQKQSGFVLFPDGLKAGYASKFDSIFGHKTSDTNPAASTANRLIVSDAEMHRGWSPLYDLMPDVKCGGNFCGDLTGTALFDYFAQADTQFPFNDQPISIKIPSAINLCNLTMTYPAGSRINQANDICTYANGNVQYTFFPEIDGSGCTTKVGDVCSSPESIFQVQFGTELKKIYVQGQIDYTSFSTYSVVNFSHFFQPVFTATTSTTCTGGGSPLTVSTTAISGASTLFPDTACNLVATVPTAFAKASYDSGNETYRVHANPATAYGKVSFTDSLTFRSLIMLPPEQRETKEVFRTISESIGALGIRDTFKNEGDQNNGDRENPNEKKFGSLRRTRGMFSSNGPSAIFDHTVSCASLTGTQSITFAEEGKTKTYEVTIQTINAAHPTWNDPLFLRPNSYCVGNNPSASSCLANSGRYEKKMMIKKDGLLEEILLFDCSQKAGRLESVSNEYEDGKYRREKEILLWNSEDMTKARFERKSIGMEANANTYSLPSIQRKSYEFEKIFKSATAQIDGRIIKYSLNRDSLGNLGQNLNSLRFNVVSTTLDYAAFNFHEDITKNFFIDPNYASLSTDTFNSAHFCGTVSFPLVLDASCSTNPFSAPGTGGVDYLVIQPSTFVPSMVAPGYFPIGWN